MNASPTSDNATRAELIDAQLIALLQATVYPDCSASAICQVLLYCQALDLDPLRKPVHLVPLWNAELGELRETLVPGIGLYRTIAARSGWAGMDEPEFGPDITEVMGGRQLTYPQWCRVSVRRRLASGETVQFTAKEFWKENVAFSSADTEAGFAQAAPNEMWSRRPYGQLAKCTEAQALRKAFPEIGSQPVMEELDGKAQRLAARRFGQRQLDAAPATGSNTGDVFNRQAPTTDPQHPATEARKSLIQFPRAKADVSASSPADPGQPMPGRAEHQNDAATVHLEANLRASPKRQPRASKVERSANDHHLPAGCAAAAQALVAPAPAPSPAPAAPGSEPATAGEKAYLLKRIAAKGMTVAAARAAAGLAGGDTLEDVTRSAFAALKGVTA